MGLKYRFITWQLNKYPGHWDDTTRQSVYIMSKPNDGQNRPQKAPDHHNQCHGDPECILDQCYDAEDRSCRPQHDR